MTGSIAMALTLLAVLVAPACRAQEAAGWLARAAQAAGSANYSGVYVYSGAGVTESVRVTRLLAPGGDTERIESLDGARREIVRRGDEIHYFFLDSKSVRVDRRVSGRSFPAVLPADASTLAPHYRVEAGNGDRVAGRAVQVILLRALDDSRYSQEIAVDQVSGLPLRLRVLDPRGETIEQFAFTEVSIGGRFNPRQALPSRRAGYAGWSVSNAIVTDVSAGDSALSNPAGLPAGFRRVAQVSRQWPGQARPVIQAVYTDGLASLSIFMEPDLSKLPGSEGISQRGALSLVTRAVGAQALIAVGELPAAALKKVAESIGPGTGARN